MWKSWKRSCSWTAPLTWTSSLPTPLMKIWQGLPLGLGTKRPSRIWVEDKNTRTCMHIPVHRHLCARASDVVAKAVWKVEWPLQCAVFSILTHHVYFFMVSRRNCPESLLLWHIWSHWHHGPRDRSQSRSLPCVSRHIGGRIVQRRVSGDWALDGNRRSVCRHQPHSKVQRLPRSRSRQWNLWVPGLYTHTFQQLHELRRWAITRKFTPFLGYPESHLTTCVTCRWLLHGLLHPEPGGEDALLPGPHLPDLATCVQTSSGTDATTSGGAAS